LDEYFELLNDGLVSPSAPARWVVSRHQQAIM
jgi:hypothetical protein